MGKHGEQNRDEYKKENREITATPHRLPLIFLRVCVATSIKTNRSSTNVISGPSFPSKIAIRVHSAGKINQPKGYETLLLQQLIEVFLCIQLRFPAKHVIVAHLTSQLFGFAKSKNNQLLLCLLFKYFESNFTPQQHVLHRHGSNDSGVCVLGVMNKRNALWMWITNATPFSSAYTQTNEKSIIRIF